MELASLKLLAPSLQGFLAVARTGTVHAAAAELRLTQTGVTRRIAALESALGASLFLRSRRGMQLTDAGQALLAYCKQAVDLEGEALAAIVGGTERRPRLVLQGPSSMLRSRVIPAVAAALRRHPLVGVDFRIDDVTSGVLALKQGHVDLAVLPRGDVAPEFDSKRLRPERYVLVGPPKWASRPLAEVVAKERIVDFDAKDQVTLSVLAEHGLAGSARADRHFVNNTDALASLVEEGFGYSALALDFATPRLDAGRLVTLGRRRYYDYELALAWYPRRHMPGYFKDAVAAVK